MAQTRTNVQRLQCAKLRSQMSHPTSKNDPIQRGHIHEKYGLQNQHLSVAEDYGQTEPS